MLDLDSRMEHGAWSIEHEQEHEGSQPRHAWGQNCEGFKSNIADENEHENGDAGCDSAKNRSAAFLLSQLLG